MSDDVVSRAKAALDRTPCPCGERECNRPNPRELARLVPELVAEIEKLRAWVAAVVEQQDRGVCPVCKYLFSECECSVVGDSQ